MTSVKSDGRESAREEEGEFRQLLSYTVPGYASGVVLAVVLDQFGLQRSGVGQWLVRTLSGEGESLFEGVFALRQRVRRASASMAEAYGWGKLAGVGAPWVIDWASRALGVNVYGAGSFYIPYFYALSDQIGANVSGFLFLRREEGTWSKAAARYARDPVMLASLAVILLVPVGLLLARLAGFSPTTQLYTAFETIAANLCWVPPVVGWLAERRDASAGQRGPS
ncbi:MAG TPA: hypothetical protein VMT45_13480 [Thermoanaerobaculaceae bacterium]|nr:hypothetical protein [Thermoanaerobaculaceae bacterium]